MSTIPASQVVLVNPSVLSAGGSALILNGMVLTQNTRVPVGQVVSAPNTSTSVSAFFGPASAEAANAAIYFKGFTGCTQLPQNIFFAQYNQVAVSAWLRGAPINTLTIAQLQAIAGTLALTVDGYAYSGTINLAGATSYSAAAALIQSAMNTSLPAAASFTGAIASGTASITASIAGNVMYVTGVASGSIQPGSILTGNGVTAGTVVQSQLSGTAGGVGTYAVSTAQTLSSGSMTATYGTLTVSAVASGTLSIGQTITGAGITAGTQIWALGTGAGLAGTYIVSPGQTVASESMTTTASPLAVTYDSISGGFLINSGSLGTASTIAFPTSNLAGSLGLTQASGATTSQGAYAQTPSTFMTNLTQITQNWGLFMSLFDPDGGSGNVQKQAFSAWVNNQNNRYGYVCWDSDVTPTLSAQATTSLGYILQQLNSSGTCPIYDPQNANMIAAFVLGAVASINFGATNGRSTLAFRSQTGLQATVTNATVAANLAGPPQQASYGNGYNFYGAYATANASFVFFNRGSISGPFMWLDSYVNQIYLNAQLQLALMNLATAVGSIPYNASGYNLISQAIQDPINQALNFGAIRAGVTLSSVQVAAINQAAGSNAAPQNGLAIVSGLNAAQILQQQGWFLQIQPASPQTRQSRTSPTCLFWYVDGESVQAITLNSIQVQ